MLYAKLNILKAKTEWNTVILNPKYLSIMINVA